MKLLFKSKKTKLSPQVNKILKINSGHFRTAFYLSKLLSQIKEIEGDIVECGVGKGGSLRILSTYTYFEGPENRDCWGFDSFEGFPEPSTEDFRPDKPNQAKRGEICVPMASCLGKLQDALPNDWIERRVKLVKGFFEDTLHQFSGKRIAFLHVDADLYGSYKSVLRELYPKVAHGGIVAFDDYNLQDKHPWPGANKAVDEFVEANGLKLNHDGAYDKYFIKKP